MNRSICILLSLFALPSMAPAQTCVSKIFPTTDARDYNTNNNGTVIDAVEQLIWQRCALGQTWKNENCVGKAKLAGWIQAKNLAADLNKNTSSNWRLPSTYELSRITELGCENPAINLQLFPNAPSIHFWTSVEFVNDTNKAWLVFFGTGENHTAKKSTKAAIRLVRTIRKQNN